MHAWINNQQVSFKGFFFKTIFLTISVNGQETL